MKTFEILVKAYTTIIVEAADEDAALEVASDVLHKPSGWEVDEFSVDEELSTPEEIERAIRHSCHHQDEFEKEPYR